MADVNVPLAGKMSKKALVFILGGSAAIVGFLWYRHRQSAAAAAAPTTTATSAIDPATGLPYSQEAAYDPNAIDPATGIPYSEEYGSTGLGGYGGYYGGGGGAAGVTGTSAFPVATTNGQWAQAAESYLGGIGIDPATLSAALGKYLTGQAVTTDQQSLIDQAIAAEGYPPQSGPNGYPPAVQTQPTGGQGGNVTVPNVVGQVTSTALSTLSGVGLVGHITNPGGLTKANSTVQSQSPAAGTSVSKGSTVTLTIAKTTGTTPATPGLPGVPGSNGTPVPGGTIVPDSWATQMGLRPGAAKPTSTSLGIMALGEDWAALPLGPHGTGQSVSYLSAAAGTSAYNLPANPVVNQTERVTDQGHWSEIYVYTPYGWTLAGPAHTLGY